MLQTGYSPHVRRAAGRVDQALRNHVFRWLRNTTGASPTSVALFHAPLHDGGFGFPELQILAAP
eukprot:6405499-Alexandrium_andersonii.AAC.1